MSLTLLQSTILFGGIHGIILAFILLADRRLTHKTAVSYLSAFVGVFSLLMLRNIAEMTEFSVKFSFLFTLSSALVPLLGPSLYLFVVRMVKQTSARNHLEYYHFLPAAGYLLFLVIAGLGFDIVDRTQLKNYPTLMIFVSVLQAVILLLLFAYIICSTHLLYQAKQTAKNYYAGNEQVSLKFLFILLSVIAIITLIWLIFFSADIELFKQARSQQALELFWLSISLSIFILGYYCLLHPQLFNLVIPKTSESYLHKDEQQLIAQQQALVALMEQEKPYLDPQLNLQQLAEKLAMKPKELTYIINHRLNRTFYELINQYRIEQIKRRLQQPQSAREKLEIIAYESGIKSSSTFNRLFKQYVNMSPKEYRAQFS
ncbi:hypothetical protein tinsulaeT_16560 [Thalassotalea insulae]|uniref:HTH araC/xylS-type domain-containing protein n=1 Tax=Thalassotalea insulae TaxID=2056778 RepID=A0ABQ6GUF4_9GAMM|nr:helix-turn-helix domain-containing protein [Thalassotalea insulae]GLX78316.1 hypothetical protein tinsulaeT_16560 [Thalassotalea insulae]